MFFSNLILKKNCINSFWQNYCYFSAKRCFCFFFISLTFLFCFFSSVSFGVEKKKKEIIEKLVASTVFCVNDAVNDEDPCVFMYRFEFKRSDFNDEGVLSSTGIGKIDLIKRLRNENFVFKIKLSALNCFACLRVFLELGEEFCFRAICELHIHGNELSFFDNHRSGFTDFLCEIIKSSKILNGLYFRGCFMDEYAVEELAKAMKHNETIIDLRFGKFSSFSDLLKILETNSSIRSLNISDNIVRENDLMKLSMLLKNLKKLDLSFCGIGLCSIEEFISFCDLLRNNEIFLEVLNISFNGICGEKIILFAEALGSNKTLKSVDISRNGMSCYGAMEIAKAIENNETIIRLNLSRNEIGCKGIKIISEAIKKNKSLEYLDIFGNDVKKDDEGFEAIEDLWESSHNTLKYINFSYHDDVGIDRKIVFFAKL